MGGPTLSMDGTIPRAGCPERLRRRRDPEARTSMLSSLLPGSLGGELLCPHTTLARAVSCCAPYNSGQGRLKPLKSRAKILGCFWPVFGQSNK